MRLPASIFFFAGAQSDIPAGVCFDTNPGNIAWLMWNNSGSNSKKSRLRQRKASSVRRNLSRLIARKRFRTARTSIWSLVDFTGFIIAISVFWNLTLRFHSWITQHKQTHITLIQVDLSPSLNIFGNNPNLLNGRLSKWPWLNKKWTDIRWGIDVQAS